MPGSKLPPGLKALKIERPDVVAKMLKKPVDEVKKMMEGGKVKMLAGGLLPKFFKKRKKMLGMQDGGNTSTAMKRKNKKKMGKCPRDGIAKTGKTKGRMA